MVQAGTQIQDPGLGIGWSLNSVSESGLLQILPAFPILFPRQEVFPFPHGVILSPDTMRWYQQNAKKMLTICDLWVWL